MITLHEEGGPGRAYTPRPELKVNSGYRCLRHNVNIGGVAQSQHLHFATDIQPVGGAQYTLDAIDQLGY